MKFDWARVLVGIMAVTAAAPACAGDIIPPKVLAATPSGINVIDAAYQYSVTDLSIGPLTLTRFHVPGKLKPNNPLIGTNMSHNFDIYVASNDIRKAPYTISPIVHIGQSSSGTYDQLSGSLANVAAGNDDAVRSGQLAWSGGNTWTSGHYIYTDREGVIYTFTNAVQAGTAYNSERVAQIAFPDGRTQTFSYNASGQLKLVSDSSGYAIVFDYNAAGETSAACGFDLAQTYVTATSTCTGATLKVSYGYDASNNLTSVTAVDGQVTTYPGNTHNSITCVQPPGYSTCKVSIVYTTFPGYTATAQTLADGSTWQVTGGVPEVANDPEYNAVTDGDTIASFTDPAGKTTSFTFTKSSPRTITDPDGRTTTYTYVGGLSYTYTGSIIYHEGTMLIEADMPEGNKYLAEYNGPGFSLSKETAVPKPGSGLPNLVKQYGYSCPGNIFTGSCTKPTSIIDPKGNETDFTYASWGGVLSEMQPAPSAGAARPLKLYTYVQMSAYVKNSGGTLVSTGVPIWMLSSVTQCQTVAGSSTAACDTAAGAPRLQTTYQYATGAVANNLLVRGTEVKDLVTGTTRLSCFTYDPIGRKISATSPRGNASISVCP